MPIETETRAESMNAQNRLNYVRSDNLLEFKDAA